jgi:hypothetical protein
MHATGLTFSTTSSQRPTPTRLVALDRRPTHDGQWQERPARSFGSELQAEVFIQLPILNI